tara:strand:+ start:457 stop:831 length:375 start_codon:yes stop_codon:yes gene_type:complete
MKKSELKNSIKEEIIDVLSEVTPGDVKATPEDVKAQKEFNKELEKTKELQDELMEENDEEPTTAQLKTASKDSVSTIANKLQQITKEMKSTVNKWKTAEGEDKQKLRDKLLKLTNIKKELESML